jgi:hypothetical protein
VEQSSRCMLRFFLNNSLRFAPTQKQRSGKCVLLHATLDHEESYQLRCVSLPEHSCWCTVNPQPTSLSCQMRQCQNLPTWQRPDTASQTQHMHLASMFLHYTMDQASSLYLTHQTLHCTPYNLFNSSSSYSQIHPPPAHSSQTHSSTPSPRATFHCPSRS